MSSSIQSQRIAQVRAFNRLFTRHIGVLNERLLRSEFTLTEMRVLYELAQGDQQQAILCRDLGLDRGYLSRIVSKFEAVGLVAKVASATDGRVKLLHLTAHGHAVYAPLEQRSRDDIGALLARFQESDQRRLLDAMRVIHEVLGQEGALAAAPALTLRAHQPGDMDWITRRHGAIYSQRQGWDDSFETLVGDICAQFERDFDPTLEHCWIAELAGERVGSVAVARSGEPGVAKLRLLLVEEAARGHGIGARLVEQCHSFARSAGYRKMRLWTTDQQQEARQLYLGKGYVLVAQEPVHAFGKAMVNEIWEMQLQDDASLSCAGG